MRVHQFLALQPPEITARLNAGLGCEALTKTWIGNIRSVVRGLAGRLPREAAEGVAGVGAAEAGLKSKQSQLSGS